MRTTPRRTLPATGLAGCRRLGVLLVLAGVLAMHALSGGSHLGMSGADAAEAGGQLPVPATAGRSDVPDVHLMAGALMAGMAPAHGGATPQTRAGPARPVAAAASASPAAAPGSGVQTACLAVLLGLVLLAARAAVGVRRLPQAPAAHSAGHSSAPLGRGPPGQLLAQLCVLRT